MKYSGNVIGQLVKSNDIEQIGQHLFNCSDITKIYFARVFDDGTTTLFTNMRDWVVHKFKHNYPIIAPAPENLISKKFHYIPDGNKLYQKVVHELNAIFHIYHPIYFVERYIGYYDVFIFCSDLQDTSIINYYLNHLDELEKFKLYFYEKADSLIQKGLQHKLTLTPEARSNLKGIQPNEKYLPSSKFKDFFSQDISVPDNLKSLGITKREWQCSRMLIKGYTAKEMAQNLEISHRTIEVFLQNLKRKLGCYRKSDVIRLLTKLS